MFEDKVARREASYLLRTFDLAAMDDDELVACSKALQIGLSRDEMKAAQSYFKGKGRAATDVELEALGQAWSEHCCYKTSKPVLKRNVYGICEDQIICREDAGLMDFDGDWAYAAKLESHNHPSAIEPYGGAATGVGGVLRDVVCMGAQPVALVDPLFFGPLDIAHEDLPAGVKHPRFLLGGVVAGIRDYGNRVGIPTVAGGINFHAGYTGNCLVNVGCIGVVKKDKITHSRAGGVGDIFVYIGNATGRDGIHGVSFASEELNEASEDASRSAVQVGDSILKEPLIHVTLEVIEKGLVTGCKDFGGGGLSCVCGELAYDAGFGCEIDLDKVPTKVPGMAPWEIWVSESQERMMVTCKPDQVDKVLAVAKKWDVPAVAMGRVIKEKVNRVRFDGEVVLELDLEFSTGGPVYTRPAKEPTPTTKRIELPEMADLEDILPRLLRHPNVMSKEWVIRQYDHEVRAQTVLKPLQGIIGREGPGDAAVIKPVRDSNKALALCTDVNPRLMSRDPYRGAKNAMDEVVRNITSVGARLSSVCDNLNFGNPEKPERMGELEAAARGLGEMARALNIPFSSGNVSLYNEGPKGPIPPTPTLLGIGILSHFKHATSLDLKAAGDLLIVVGETTDELGGSLLLDQYAVDGDPVPDVDAKRLIAAATTLRQAIEAGLVRSAHDASEGGLAVAAAEMAFAGGLGATLDLQKAPGAKGLRPDVAACSETPTRWIIEVKAKDEKAVLSRFAKAGVPAATVGKVEDTASLVLRHGGTDATFHIGHLRDTWAHAFGRLMGVEA